MKTAGPRASLAALGCLLLAGCFSAAPPRLPQLRVPAQYGAGAATPPAVVALGIADPARESTGQSWWQGFGDVRLTHLVERVLAVNADLVSAGLRLRRARLEAGLARNDQWPQPSATVDASASRVLNTEAAVQRSSDATVSLSWEIDLWGRLRAARDVAQWEAQASVQDRENTALALVGEVCEQYWRLAYLNQSIAAGQAYLTQLARILQLVRVQFAAGAAALLAVREAEQNLAAQRIAQSQLSQERAEVRNALTVLLDGQTWSPDEEPLNLAVAHRPVIAAGLPAELLGRRPDLRAAELRLRKALASIQATARSYYPALTLTGSAGTSSTSLTDVLRNPLGTLGAGLTLPFLNIPRMQLATDVARTDYEIAVSDFRSTLYTALQDVENALHARAQLTIQLVAAQHAFEAAQEIERLYGVQYRAGAVALRTWLDAQQTRRDAELALAQVERDQLLNDVTLHLALGGEAD